MSNMTYGVFYTVGEDEDSVIILNVGNNHILYLRRW